MYCSFVNCEPVRCTRGAAPHHAGQPTLCKAVSQVTVAVARNSSLNQQMNVIVETSGAFAHSSDQERCVCSRHVLPRVWLVGNELAASIPLVKPRGGRQGCALKSLGLGLSFPF